MNKHPCQCEHGCHMHGPRASAHFGVDKNAPRQMSPDGNPSHQYGTEFFLGVMSRVKTPQGTYIVCKDCEEDCHWNETAEVTWLCRCGSGKDREDLTDARGIFVAHVCSACIEETKKKYRPEIFEDSQYTTTEAIEEE